MSENTKRPKSHIRKGFNIFDFPFPYPLRLGTWELYMPKGTKPIVMGF